MSPITGTFLVIGIVSAYWTWVFWERWQDDEGLKPLLWSALIFILDAAAGGAWWWWWG